MSRWSSRARRLQAQALVEEATPLSESSVPAPGLIPTTVVTGSRGSGKSRLIAQLRALRPARERWAFLSNTPDPAGGGGGQEPAGAIGGSEFFHVAGGCACCLTGPAFRTTLVRLLRAGPWQRLHIEMDPAGHPHRLVDQLRLPPFDQYLWVDKLLLTLQEAEYPLYQAGDDLLGASGRLAFATDFLLEASPQRNNGRAPDAGPGRASDFVRRLESALPWPRRLQPASATREPTEPGLPADVPGWAAFGALPARSDPALFDLVRQWPGEAFVERRPFKALLSTLATTEGVAGFQALMHTSRAWYRWGFGQGDFGRGDSGSPAFDDGPNLVESETAWRFDNRFCLWLAPGSTPPQVARIEGLVAALEQQIQSSGSLPASIR
jgi:hypothetical protein